MHIHDYMYTYVKCNHSLTYGHSHTHPTQKACIWMCFPWEKRVKLLFGCCDCAFAIGFPSSQVMVESMEGRVSRFSPSRYMSPSRREISSVETAPPSPSHSLTSPETPTRSSVCADCLGSYSSCFSSTFLSCSFSTESPLCLSLAPFSQVGTFS